MTTTPPSQPSGTNPPLADADARRRALDPLASYCVTAPAGSGKTELLIQRYLVLLARVAQPEEVLAITFTRKAAAEMRARVVDALRRGRDPQPPSSPHQRQTWELARAVLAVDGERGWGLGSNPARFNIRTIDGFCATLTRQMPILSHFGGAISPGDQVWPMYRRAIRALLDHLAQGGPYSADIESLLLHFDGNWQRLEEALIRMLERRDQWLLLMGARGLEREGAEAALKRSVDLVIADTLGAAERALAPWRERLLKPLTYSQIQRGIIPATPAAPGTPDSPSDNPNPRPAGNPGGDATPAPPNNPDAWPQDLDGWLALADLLLTGSGTWRKTLNKNNGFPAGNEQSKAMKKQLLEAIATMSLDSSLPKHLLALRHLPRQLPDDARWQLVLAASRVLPLLTAELNLVFQQAGEVDHTEVAIAALRALGGDEQPTELALKLDYQLRHVLVDEFQDTSVQQYELVRRLCRGWAVENANNPDNPRTLFIVGDGMQSIYGFRNAEVGLFVRARDRGFDDLRLEPLVLQSNFRSGAGLVEWVNRTFPAVFPAEDEVRLGEVRFSPATHVHPQQPGRAVNMAAFENWQEDTGRRHEARWLADRIEEGQADSGCESMAVLVRARGHLVHLVEELKARGVGWQAQDIDLLADSPVVRDLMALLRALHNHSDRVAWLAVLRAPWCGLDLADLHCVAAHSARRTLSACLGEGGFLDGLPGLGLSERGRAALARVAGVLARAARWREVMGIGRGLQATWTQLGGPACVGHEDGLGDAAALFDLLRGMDDAGQPFDLAFIEERVAALFAPPGGADAKLQLMTIHKSKGLEFDWVFIPGLERTPPRGQRELLQWDEYHSADSADMGFMLAIDDFSDAGEPTLYNYLHRQRQHKREQETNRLLYVGATRAAKRLFLTASVTAGEEGWKPPGKGSLLGRLWGPFQGALERVHSDIQDAPAGADGADTAEDIAAGSRLVRLVELPAGLEDAPPTPPASDVDAPEGMDESRSESAALNVERTGREVGLGAVRGRSRGRSVQGRIHSVPETDLPPRAPDEQSPASTQSIEPPNTKAIETGNLVHLSLQRLSLAPLPAAGELNLDAWGDWWRSRLAATALPAAECEDVLARVQQAVLAVLADERGRWLLSPQRERAASEYSLSTAGERSHDPQEHVIDRTFIAYNDAYNDDPARDQADGETAERWVVDYKSSVPNSGESMADFEGRMAERHGGQLARYRDALTKLEGLPVRTALYFPLLPHWLEVQPTKLN